MTTADDILTRLRNARDNFPIIEEHPEDLFDDAIKRIAELEAKLAERDDELEEMRKVAARQIGLRAESLKEVGRLEAELAEAEKCLEGCKFSLRVVKAHRSKLRERLAEAEKERDKYDGMLERFDSMAIKATRLRGGTIFPGTCWCETLDDLLQDAIDQAIAQREGKG